MGTFAQSGGINNFGYGNGANQFLCLGYNAGSNGTYQLSGSGILTTYVSANETVGFSGTGDLYAIGRVQQQQLLLSRLQLGRQRHL